MTHCTIKANHTLNAKFKDKHSRLSLQILTGTWSNVTVEWNGYGYILKKSLLLTEITYLSIITLVAVQISNTRILCSLLKYKLAMYKWHSKSKFQRGKWL